MSSSCIDASTSPSLPLTPLQINTKLYSKYNSSNISYGIKKIDDLIFLETSLYTNKFREFLLYDEETDFLRRFYTSKEQIPKLKNILLFYKKYSKIFPNYIIMSGSKYLYKNIQKKQKMINNLQEMKKQEKRNRKLCLTITNESNLLGLTTMNSIMNVSSSFYKRNLMILFGFYNENNNNINVNVYDNNDDITYKTISMSSVTLEIPSSYAKGNDSDFYKEFLLTDILVKMKYDAAAAASYFFNRCNIRV